MVSGRIQNKLKKLGATMEKNKHKEAGFTLISTLISLTMVLISLPLLYQLLFEVKSLKKLELTPYKFMMFITDDIHRADITLAKNNKLYFYLPSGETAIIEQYNQLIRRKVDNRGHEIYLRDIVLFETKQLESSVSVKIELKDGEQYEKVFKVNE